MDKLQIIKTMSEIKAVAENESSNLGDFLPLKNYAMLREPGRFLIIGGRGTGKTRLFKLLLEKNGFRQVIGKQQVLFQPNEDNSEFITGYQEGAAFPSLNVTGKYANDESAAAFWNGSIMFLLMRHFKDDRNVKDLAKTYIPELMLQKFENFKLLKQPSEWIPYIIESPEQWENFLDDLNEYIESENRWIFLVYDSLDRICDKYADLFPYIRTLLSFWYTHSRRWSRICSKIFLRNDLYDSQLLAFPDSSKISGNSLKLEWDTLALYRLLVKKMANAGEEEMVAYLKLTDGLISGEPDCDLGYIPTENEEVMVLFVDQLIGRYMGSNAKKGMSYSWAPNHLQDTHGALSPRSFLKCYSAAAAKMYERPGEVAKLPGTLLITPSMLQGAVVEVSEERVSELQEEYKWLKELKKSLSGVTLLIEKNEFTKKIQMNLWSEENQKQLPALSPQGIFDVLEKLGIVMVARDGRVNVPEIYLHGFGMKRKGGIRRPK